MTVLRRMPCRARIAAELIQNAFVPYRVMQRTVIFLDERLVNDIMVVHVGVYLVVVQVELDDVVHRDEAIEIAWWPGAPVLSQVGEHVDVVSQEEELGASEQNRERPGALAIPLERRRQLTTDLYHEGWSEGCAVYRQCGTHSA